MWPFTRKPTAPDDPWNGSWLVAHRTYPRRTNPLGPMFLRCNESARVLIGDHQWTHCLSVAVPLRDADHDGLPRGEEVAELFTIEEVLVRQLEDMRRGIMVLTVSAGGLRELVFYVGDPDWALQALDRARAEITTHDLQSRIENDPEWRRFRELAG